MDRVLIPTIIHTNALLLNLSYWQEYSLCWRRIMDIGILVQKGFKPIVIMMGFTSLLSSLTTGFPLPVFVNEWRERKLLLNFFLVQGKGGVISEGIFNFVPILQ